ncbi:MAG: FAD binding domain-containing protein [Synergistaceae bacterium]|jgi:NADPH-dependent glutamate synthase beta subunit-like oxidoreductase/CO/xanthine dehydrogenase FAD-binding subunit|nr:FAD binding domain-containing protein [Synergistaceae bacterium]
MKNFNYYRASDFAEAAERAEEGSVLIAGGTDLLGVLKEEVLPEYPSEVVSLKWIPDADKISVEGDNVKIGAMAVLNDIVESDVVREYVPMLAEAAHMVATPNIRNVATLGGNVCQDVRCWFYRYPHEAGGRLVCSRKGGDTCYALQGDNRNHSIFGGMKTHITQCALECPAATDIPAYMEQLRNGNVDEAARIIMRVNPMPALTSRVCAHFCEGKCNRSLTDESVSIGAVERFVGDYILDRPKEFYPFPDRETGKSIAVVGSGPSGLSAAFYLRKAGNSVTVYDIKKEAGGMLMYAIPHYRLPKDLVRKFVSHLKDMGVNFALETTVGKDITSAQLEAKYDSVYYATGAWKRPILGLAGEELTIFGLDFLVEVNEWMKGKIGSEVLVTGGGNVAIDVAITAKRLGASHVTLACLEPFDMMPAGKEEIARAREEGIEIMPSWGLDRVLDENGTVKGMRLKRCVSVLDEHGSFSPRYDENEKTTVYAENILMAVGQKADLSFLDEKYQMQLNRRGLIDVAEDTQMTSRRGVFAGGDVTTGPATVIKAITTGRAASRGIASYLGVAHDDDPKPLKNFFVTCDTAGILKKDGAKLKELPPDERNIKTEDTFSLSEDEALEEAKRCQNCGCYAVNPSDIGTALVALGATIRTTQREVSAEEFCTGALTVQEQLNKGEVLTDIVVPVERGVTAHYDKFRLRDAVDFAIASIATKYGLKDGKFETARIVFGGVAPVPMRRREAEEYLIGREPSEEIADHAAEIATKDAIPFERNTYKKNEAKALLKASILRMK